MGLGQWLHGCGEAPKLTEENFPETVQSFNQIEIMLRIKSYIHNEKTEHQLKQMPGPPRPGI